MEPLTPIVDNHQAHDLLKQVDRLVVEANRIKEELRTMHNRINYLVRHVGRQQCSLSSLYDTVNGLQSNHIRLQCRPTDTNSDPASFRSVGIQHCCDFAPRDYAELQPVRHESVSPQLLSSSSCWIGMQEESVNVVGGVRSNGNEEQAPYAVPSRASDTTSSVFSCEFVPSDQPVRLPSKKKRLVYRGDKTRKLPEPNNTRSTRLDKENSPPMYSRQGTSGKAVSSMTRRCSADSGSSSESSSLATSPTNAHDKYAKLTVKQSRTSTLNGISREKSQPRKLKRRRSSVIPAKLRRYKKRR